MNGLFVAEERPPPTSCSAALVAVPAGVCPDCGAATDELVYSTDALFRHAGYGAAQRMVCRTCACGWILIAEISDVRPTSDP